MIASLDFIADRFDYFNKLCFQGSLPTPKFQISSAKTFAGQMKYRRNVSSLRMGIPKCEDFRLCISRRFDLPQNEIEDTIIHEMIHYYIAYNGIRDTSPHGRVFREMMNGINHRFNRNISISIKKKTVDQSGETAQSSKLVIICLMRLVDGATVLAIPTRTRIFEFREAIAQSAKVAASAWYASRNRFFDRYPHTMKGTVYHISADDIRKELSDAYTIIFTPRGLTIRPNIPPTRDFGGCLP